MKQLLFCIMIITCFIACIDNQVGTFNAVAEEKQIDNVPAECPYLTKDDKGNTVLSWVRMLNDSTTAFCYAICEDGKTFSTPVVIPNSGNIQPHGENLPKIIFKPSGDIIALWGAANPNPKNKYSGLVSYTQSFDNGKTWTEVKPLVADTASYDQRYYDVAVLPNGEIGAVWLDNRKTTEKEGSGLFFAYTNGRTGFENGDLISEPCCQCCRTDLFVDKKNGIHVLYRGIVQDSIRDMVHIVSTDAGKTFSAPKRINDDNWVINGCPHTGPAMTENKDGLHFAWFTGATKKGCFYTSTKDNGKTFAIADNVSSKGSHPQITALSNDDLVIVWDESSAVGNKVSKRIGIERRTDDGKVGVKEYITKPDGNSGFPVVATLNENSFVVAYSNKNGDKDYVSYQILKLK